MENIRKTKNRMTLGDLLAGIIDSPIPSNVEISGITSDSREVQPGYLFAAFQGLTTDGCSFIADAAAKGAVAIIAEQEMASTPNDIPVIIDSDITQKLGKIASRFWDDPSSSLEMIGVTGTNGKTSIVNFIAQALTLVEKPCGVIGTLGAGMFGDVVAGQFTTPYVIETHQTLAKLRDRGAKTVAMEVSSHALEQHRVDNVQFETAIFTNLSHDHLDYHGSMDEYWRAKQKLFAWPSLKRVIVNIDDPRGEELARLLSKRMKVYAISMMGKTLDHCEPILVTKLTQSAKGTSARVKAPWGEGDLKTHLIGQFNISNLLAVLCVLSLNDISFDLALRILASLDTVPGRMQCIRRKGKPLVVVDYAHTPDALEKALSALRPHSSGKLWCVFGCGGGRDRDKRPMMGQIAERYSDQLIITTDNPRDEDPEDIVEDIVKGLLCGWAAEIQLDRGAAIAHAIDCASPGDIVLIAGKGHEQYQQFGAEKIPFNDVEQVEIHLKK